MVRSEVWLVDLNPTIGAEIQKIRPAVIVNDDAVGTLPLKIVVPITDWKDRYISALWLARLEPTAENGLSKISVADTFQIRSISQQRFMRRLGQLSDADMQRVTKALANALSIEPDSLPL